MAKMNLTRKQIVSITIAAIIVAAVIVGFGFIFYYYLFGTAPNVRKSMLNYCENDDNYFEVYAKITSPDAYKYNDPCVSISVEFVGGEDEIFTEKKITGLGMPLSNYNAMIASGLDTEDGETVYRFVLSAGSWYGQIYSYVVAVYSEDGDTVYLDYETGKANLLYYIKKEKI